MCSLHVMCVIVADAVPACCTRRASRLAAETTAVSTLEPFNAIVKGHSMRMRVAKTTWQFTHNAELHDTQMACLRPNIINGMGSHERFAGMDGFTHTL